MAHYEIHIMAGPCTITDEWDGNRNEAIAYLNETYVGQALEHHTGREYAIENIYLTAFGNTDIIEWSWSN